MRSTGLRSLWLAVDGLRVHCLAAGERGAPILLLHGAGIDSAALSWDEIIGPCIVESFLDRAE